MTREEERCRAAMREQACVLRMGRRRRERKKIECHPEMVVERDRCGSDAENSYIDEEVRAHFTKKGKITHGPSPL